MKNIYQSLTRPFFVLAPMDDVTDVVFRQIIADCASPDLFMTEFVNADGLQSPGRDKLLKRLAIGRKDRPIVAQIWGKRPEAYEQTAKDIVEMGFEGLDINMGCPDKTVVKNGCCSALINNRELAEALIASARDGLGGKIPLSVKTRLGFNTIDYSWHEFLLRQNLDALIVHGRTTKNMSDVPADWEAIEHIRNLRDKISPQTVIIGNGDVLNLEQGRSLAKQHGIDGIMIGRGVFHDPYVFSDSVNWPTFSPEKKRALYRKHIELFAQVYPDNERRVATLNKFCKIYINDFDGAKELRIKLMNAKNITELLKLI